MSEHLDPMRRWDALRASRAALDLRVLLARSSAAETSDARSSRARDGEAVLHRLRRQVWELSLRDSAAAAQLGAAVSGVHASLTALAHPAANADETALVAGAAHAIGRIEELSGWWRNGMTFPAQLRRTARTVVS